MNEQNNGGQAFPCDLTCYDQEARNEMRGMSLRDYFAAQAMEAFMSGWISRDIYPETDMVIAEYAYSMADAMLKARNTFKEKNT